MTVEGHSVALFGGVACSVGSRSLPMPPGKPSLLLALLALEVGRVVRTSAVIDGLWDDDPPSSARALVHTYVSALRRALDVEGAPPITTAPGGYRLDCDPYVVDVHRVLTAAEVDDPQAWEVALAESASPLLGGVEVDFAQPWQVRVDAARELLLDRVWAHRLDEGRAAEVVPELRTAVGREPLREDRVLLLARALGRTGRVDDALRVLDSYQRRLAEELGLDPSAAVPALRQDLLTIPQPPVGADPSWTSAAPAPPTRTGRWRNLAILVAVVVTVIASLVWRWAHNPAHDPALDQASALDGPGLLEVDTASGSIVGSVALPVVPTQVEANGDLVWVRSDVDQAVAALYLGSDGEADVTGVTAPPSALALDDSDAVVGLGFSGETVTVSEGLVSPPTPALEGVAGRLTLAGSADGVWLATITGDVHAPPGTAGWPASVSIGVTPARLAVDGTRAWVLSSERPELVSLASGDTPAVRSALRGENVDLTAGAEQAWAVTSGDDRLWHAAATGRVVVTRVLPGTPTAVLLVGDAVWVAMSSPPSVASYDPDTLEPELTADLPREPVDLAFADGELVVAVR